MIFTAYPTPAEHVTVHVVHSHAQFRGAFSLDPHRVCVKFNYSADPNFEPDAGPAGSDTCGGSPSRATVTIRIYRGDVRVYSRAVKASVTRYKGSWRFVAPCVGTRWVATLVNPWQGMNGSVAGGMRC